MLKFGKYILKEVNNRLEIQEFAKIYATRELTQKRHCIVTLKNALIGDNGFLRIFFFSDKINASGPSHHKHTL